MKLLIASKQGELIGQRKNELDLWVKSMMDESAEFSSCIIKRDLSLVSETKLYSIMESVLKKFKEGEIPVLFIPYPVILDAPECTFLQFTTDFLQATYDIYIEKHAISGKTVFFIYPSVKKNVYVLKNAETRVREYIFVQELESYFSCCTTSSIENEHD